MLMELNKAKEQAKSLETQCSVLQQECNNQMLQNQNQDNSKHAELQSTIDVSSKPAYSIDMERSSDFVRQIYYNQQFCMAKISFGLPSTIIFRFDALLF